MSGLKDKKRRKKCEAYKAAGTREKNKERRAARDSSRAKPLTCGHGSRYLSNIDGRCKRCVGEGKSLSSAGRLA